MYKLDYLSPIGVLEVIGTEEAVVSILFTETEKPVHVKQPATPQVLMDAYGQLDEYFKGERQTFTFPFTVDGTLFQKKVWESLQEIPFGQTASYKDIAVSIGNDQAIRAVGSANGKNKLSIVIPCHRIIGSNGKLTGYAGGLWRKEWLLQHERRNLYINTSNH
ncbi:methylated-DNA-[protein]-cysteine S-methyltransferase [Bacillus sp. SORGH_AS 510]|uniref:methylated-DNA--[protein]-cysteine S-methyltransferase n=1 Tax=Bacillus sp. SORGH_AS_0510 TaxID=3041771 RepID=UPI002782B478|nr:methylated-DNA--[protein]-cysteine S-methyltransferase [Bacillus sp. SORGH_AS_0510]MDQ1143672.1 methylated-DNA-[protein]-cysteine S-methyltransferase [Bacillus sp. SORGH_AS_0510]